MPQTSVNITEYERPCPQCGAQVESIEYEAGVIVAGPLGSMVDDPGGGYPRVSIGQMVRHAGGGEARPFPGANLWTLHPCGDTFRELPEEFRSWERRGVEWTAR